jgi:hypothetical protein
VASASASCRSGFVIKRAWGQERGAPVARGRAARPLPSQRRRWPGAPGSLRALGARLVAWPAHAELRPQFLYDPLHCLVAWDAISAVGRGVAASDLPRVADGLPSLHRAHILDAPQQLPDALEKPLARQEALWSDGDEDMAAVDQVIAPDRARLSPDPRRPSARQPGPRPSARGRSPWDQQPGAGSPSRPLPSQRSGGTTERGCAPPVTTARMLEHLEFVRIMTCAELP